MMKQKTIKRFLMAILMVFISLASFAQSKGDKYFMEGQNFEKVASKSSSTKAKNANLRKAIDKYKAAKVAYTTPEKKKVCDNQIAICENKIHQDKPNPPIPPTPAPGKLTISQDRISFDGDKAGNTIVHVESSSNWNVNLPEGIEGEMNFTEVSKGEDSKSLVVSVKVNPTTLTRIQTINITNESQSKKIIVKQQGKTVKLSANSGLVEFGVKGGSKSIELYTNSDSIVASNNDLAWYVESKPEWIEVSTEMKKKKGIVGKGISAIKGLVDGKSEVSLDEDMRKSEITIVDIPLIKSDKEYQTGRRGEIVFASQDKRYKVIVVQQTKK